MRKGIYIIFLSAFFFLAAFNVNVAVSNKSCYRKSSMSMVPMNDEKLIIRYTYDEFGNRTKRELVLVPVTRAVSSTKSATDDGAVEKPGEKLQPGHEDIYAEVNIRVYPNPSQGMFWIDIAGVDIPRGAQAEVYRLNGTPVRKWTGLSPIHGIDISGQPAGIYFLRITLDKNFERVWKIIKN